jgi:glycine/sarcosine/betaine reductase complex component A
VVDEYAGDVVVLLGSPDADSTSIYAETVTLGDPTYAGPLAGVPLGLPVFHILEPEIKAQVDPDIYDEQVGVMELALDSEAIRAEIQKIRDQVEAKE